VKGWSGSKGSPITAILAGIQARNTEVRKSSNFMGARVKAMIHHYKYTQSVTTPTLSGDIM